jgi:hypothetical protein
MGEMRNTYKIWVGKSKGKGPVGRCRRGWEDDIRIDLREIGSERVDRMRLAQDRDKWRAVVNMVINLRGP